MKTRRLLFTLVVLAMLIGSFVAMGPAHAQDSITIRVLFPQINATDNNIQKQFESDIVGSYTKKNAKVKFVVEYVPDFNKLQEKLTTDFAANQPPDVFIIGVGWVEAFAAQLLPLGDKFSKDELKDFTEGMINSSSYKGVQYGVPLVLDTRLLLYRKDMFKAAGLDPEKPPTSWQELREAAIKLTKRNAKGELEVAGFDIPRGGATRGSRSPRQHWFTFLWQYGGELFDKDLTKCTANSKEGVAALQAYIDFALKDKVIDNGFETGIPNTSLMTVDKAAMAFYHNNYWANEILKKPELKDKIGVMPPFKNPNPGMFYGGWILVAAKNTKNPDVALDVIKHLTASDAALWMNEKRGGVPARLSLRDAKYVKDNLLVSKALEYLPNARAEGGPKQWLQIRSLFDPALEEAILGTKTPEAVLNDICAKSDKIIKENP